MPYVHHQATLPVTAAVLYARLSQFDALSSLNAGVKWIRRYGAIADPRCEGECALENGRCIHFSMTRNDRGRALGITVECPCFPFQSLECLVEIRPLALGSDLSLLIRYVPAPSVVDSLIERAMFQVWLKSTLKSAATRLIQIMASNAGGREREPAPSRH